MNGGLNESKWGKPVFSWKLQIQSKTCLIVILIKKAASEKTSPDDDFENFSNSLREAKKEYQVGHTGEMSCLRTQLPLPEVSELSLCSVIASVSHICCKCGISPLRFKEGLWVICLFKWFHCSKVSANTRSCPHSDTNKDEYRMTNKTSVQSCEPLPPKLSGTNPWWHDRVGCCPLQLLSTHLHFYWRPWIVFTRDTVVV